jgi:hypothetical protein
MIAFHLLGAKGSLNSLRRPLGEAVVKRAEPCVHWGEKFADRAR